MLKSFETISMAHVPVIVIRYNGTWKMVIPPPLAIRFRSDTRSAHCRVSTSTLKVPLPSITLKSQDLKWILDHY